MIGLELTRSFGGPHGRFRGWVLGEGVGRGGCGRSCDHAAQAFVVLVVRASGGDSDPVQLQSVGRSGCVYAPHRCSLWLSTFL